MSSALLELALRLAWRVGFPRRYWLTDLWLMTGRGYFGIEFVNAWLERSPSRELSRHVLQRFGARVAGSANVASHLIIDNAVTEDYSHLRLGERAYLGKGCFLDLVEGIDIDDDASVSAGCVLLTHADPGTGRLMELTYFPRVTGAVRIGCFAWIGAGSTVLPGVQVGECSVIGAGSVVLHDVEPFTVVAGVPAQLVRRLPLTSLEKST